MITRVSLAGVLPLLATTCGTDDVVGVDLEEVCGVDEPFRVLELPPDQQITYATLHIGDRRIYHVRQRGEDVPSPAYNPPKVIFPAFEDTTVWSTGPCGESPKPLLSGVTFAFTVDIWPDALLACTDDGDIVRLDPHGEDPPHVVFAEVPHTFGCGLGWTPHGLLSVDDHGDGTGALVLHPYPADPRGEAAAVQVLLDPILTEDTSGSGSSRGLGEILRTFDEFVLAITPAGILVRVELATGLVTQVQPGVRGFSSSSDGRYIVWQDDEITDDDPDHPAGDIYLRDQQTLTDSLLARTSLHHSMLPLQWVNEGIVQIGLGHVNTDPLRIFFLPGLEHVDLPARLMLRTRLGERRWLTSPWFTSDLEVFDLDTLDATPLALGGEIRFITDDALELFAAEPCCITGDNRDVAPIWRVPLDGGEPQKLVAEASRRMKRLADGRYLGPVRLDDAWLGPLVLADPDTGAVQRLDDHVFSHSVDVSRVDVDDGLITYSVADGDRSGVYVARLPAGTRGRAHTEPLPLADDVAPGPHGPALQPRHDPPRHIVTGAR